LVLCLFAIRNKTQNKAVSSNTSRRFHSSALMLAIHAGSGGRFVLQWMTVGWFRPAPPTFGTDPCGGALV
jgi:hypothetical protein